MSSMSSPDTTILWVYPVAAVPMNEPTVVQPVMRSLLRVVVGGVVMESAVPVPAEPTPDTSIGVAVATPAYSAQRISPAVEAEMVMVVVFAPAAAATMLGE